MLKYFGGCFFLFFLISLPTHHIYSSGNAFKQEDELEEQQGQVPLDGVVKLMGQLTLGNLNDRMSSECFSADIDQNKQASFNLECTTGDNGKGYSMTALTQFGLAFQSYTCTGLGSNMKVDTVKKCSIQTMDETYGQAL